MQVERSRSQMWIYAAVAILVILIIGIKWPKTSIWILGLILLAALMFRWEQLRAAIFGG